MAKRFGNIADLFPPQGQWTEEQYFALPGKRFIEYVDGRIEILPYPNMRHQLIAGSVLGALRDFVMGQSLGEVFPPLTRLRVVPRLYRALDITVVLNHNVSHIAEEYCGKADLVIEILGSGTRIHDLKVKRFDYAKGGIPEYWIVDPVKEELTILKLTVNRYKVHGIFHPRQTAESATLPGLVVDVSKVFED